MTEDGERTALYRLYNRDGVLLYVGITNNPDRRFAQHAADKHWWWQVSRRHVEWFDSRGSALAAEEMAIKVKDPRYNYEHSRYRPVAKLTIELTEADMEGLDILARLALPEEVRTREQLVQMIIGRELSARGLYGEERCFHFGAGWPEGVDVRAAQEGVCPCGGAIRSNGTYPPHDSDDRETADAPPAQGAEGEDEAA